MASDGFFASLPEKPCDEREAALLQRVMGGEIAPIEWMAVTSQHGGHTATVWVSRDALRVNDGDESIRINVTARTAQRIADVLGALLPTPRICDLVWEQAEVRIAPSFQVPGPEMAGTSRMLKHHQAVEEKVDGRAGLIENVGKHWVITRRLEEVAEHAANYGWYDLAAPSTRGAHRMWQPVGMAHNLEHVDYSQVLRLVCRECEVDGEPRDLTEILQDRVFSGLVSDEGPLPFWRIPSVDRALVSG